MTGEIYVRPIDPPLTVQAGWYLLGDAADDRPLVPVEWELPTWYVPRGCYRTTYYDSGLGSYQPAGTFVVDDIRYRKPCRDDREHVRPMIQVIDDGESGRMARMDHRHPPTDEELNDYVRTGEYPRQYWPLNRGGN